MNNSSQHSSPPNRQEPTLTVVVPCYNEEEVLPETANRLGTLLADLIRSGDIDPASHILFVDDGSKDTTWQLIETVALKNKTFKGLKLSRNKGHQYALLAGLHTAEGDAVVSIDADLQDDVNAITQMLLNFKTGDDVVYGVRNKRTSDSFLKRFTAESYYNLLGKMGVDLVHNHADFRLLSRPALEALKCYGEVNLFIRGVIPTLGFQSSIVEYARDKRFAGSSKYPVTKMISLAINGITSFSPVPLRMISALGFFVSFVSLLLIIWALGVRFFDPEAVPGWASSVIPIYFIGGIQLLSLGIVGEYISKIYSEVKQRPRFIIERSV